MKTIRIGQSTWTVRWDSALLGVLDAVDGEQKTGLCLLEQNEIVLRENLVPAMAREALLHEILHAITYVYGLKWSLNEERMIAKLSPLLLDTLRLNPELVDFLTREEA